MVKMTNLFSFQPPLDLNLNVSAAYAYRHPGPDSRPAFCDLLLLLQRPDFQLLRWSEEDEATFSKKARTLGGPLKDGEELYTELQTVFSKSGSSATF